MKSFKSFSLKVLALILSTVLVVGMVPLYANDSIPEEVPSVAGSTPDALEIIEPAPLIPNPLIPIEIVDHNNGFGDDAIANTELKEQESLSEASDGLSVAHESTDKDLLIGENSQLSMQAAHASDLTAAQLANVYNPENYKNDFVPGEVLVGMNSGFVSPQSSQGMLSPQSANTLFPELNVTGIEDIYQSVREALPQSVKPQSSSRESRTVYLVELALDTKESVLDAIEILKQNPNVAYAEPNYIAYPNRVPNDPVVKDDDSFWNMKKIQAPEAWDIATGSHDVKVGVLDTGIDYTHPDLAANVDRNLGYYATENTRGPTADVMDYHYHGTHVAGIIGAVGNNGIGVVGVNWNVTMIPIKIAYSNTNSGSDSLIQARAVRYATELGLPIISMSYSVGPNLTLLNAVADYKGLFVISAGNSNRDRDSDTAFINLNRLGNVVFVANSQQNDTKYSASCFGVNTVALAAPGTSIYSTYIHSDGYVSVGGTSMAAPHVSGAAALILSHASHLTTAQLKNFILSSVDPVPALAGLVSTGGRLNVYNAIANIPSAAIDASPAVLDFGGQRVGYAERPTRTVTIKNNGNQNVTLNPLPTVENWTLVQGANWSTPLAPNQTKTFTVRPNTGLPTGAYEPVITITGSGGVSAQVRPLFTVALSEVILTPSNPTAIVGVGTGVSGRVPITAAAPPNERVTIVSSNVIPGEYPELTDAAGARIVIREAGGSNWSYTIPAGETMTVYADVSSSISVNFAWYTVTATWSDASLPAVEVSTTGLTNLKVGQEVSDASVAYTLTSGVYTSPITPESFTVRGLPNGLTAGTAQRTSDTVVTIPITGTPTVFRADAVTLQRASSIPASNVTGATSAIPVIGTITAAPVARGDGGAVSGLPTLQSKTSNSITVFPVENIGGTGQSVQYAISTSSTVTPTNGWQTSTTFSSLNPGTYYVYARTAQSPGYNAGLALVSTSITLEALPTSVTIIPKPLATTVGQTTQLTAAILPSNATDKTVTWSSSNTAVATVSALGSVTALSAGQATITARMVNGLTDTCVVTVTSPQPQPSIAVTTTGLTNLKVGQAVSNASVVYTLTNGTYATSITTANFTVTGLPPGLTAGTPVRTNNTVVIIPITGTPTTYNASTVTLTRATSIPAANVTGATSAITPTGTITASAIARGDGAAVSSVPTEQSKTSSSITVNTVTNAGTTGQSIEYAISTSATTTPSSGWQATTTFSGLAPGTYYVYARTAANTHYNAGPAQVSAAITLASPAIAVTATGLTNLKVGQALSNASVVYTLTNGTYATSITAANFTVIGLPAGLTAGTPQRTSNTVVTIPITGTPTTYSASTTTLTRATSIPAANVTGATSAITPTGTITASAVARGDGAAVSGIPTEQTKTSNSITVNAVTNAGATGQSVEYAISTSSTTTPTSNWQTSTTFSSLSPGAYYVYARTAANINYNAGLSRVSAAITLASPAIAVTVTGLTNLKVGQAVSNASVIYTLTNGAYATSITVSSFTVTGLPAGLTAGTPVRSSNTVVTIPITGTPTTYNASAVTLTYASSVPAASVAGATNAIVPTGTITASAIARGDGAVVSGVPTEQSKTSNSITVNAVTNAGTTGQSVEYAISLAAGTTPTSGWQATTTFSGLSPGTYYAYARTAANTNYNAGSARFSAAITLASPAIAVTTTGLTNLKVGRALSGASVVYTLTNATYATNITPSHFTVSGLPAGLIAGAAQRTSNTVVTIPITGAPTTYNASTTTLTRASSIPAANVTGATSAFVPTGTITASAIARGDGAEVSGAPTEQSKTLNSITVNSVTNVGTTGQSVEYALYKEGMHTPTRDWQASTTFSDLNPGTYYAYARTAANANYNAGALRAGLPITLSPPPASGIAVSTTGLTSLKVGQAVSGASVVYTLTNGTYATTITPSNFTVTGLPAGLTAGAAQRTSNTVVTIPITGTPTTYNASVVTLTYASSIPAANVTGATTVIVPTGTITASAVVRGDGAAVSGVPTEQSKTSSSITVNAVTNAGTTGQSVEYAISTSSTVTPTSGWQASTTFSSLSPGTYFVYARTAANTNYNVGSARVSAAITLEVVPTSVTITPKPVSTTVGQNTQLTATVLPANAADKTVTWSSSSPAVATVSALGNVTAVSAGLATITARTSNGLTDTCVVTVETAPVYSLSLTRSGSTDPYVFTSLQAYYTNPGSITLTLTNTGNRSINSLHVALSGANSGSFYVVPGANFTSIEPGATRTLTVSPRTGLVQGTYTADIVVQGDLATSNSFKVSFTVLPVHIPVQSVSISASSSIIQLGSTATLRAVILPTNATNTNVTWRSDNTNILTVDANGLVTAVGLGGTYISVTTEDGSRYRSIYITVQPKPYSIALDTTALAFAEVDPGYRAPTARTIRVTNDGTMATGALTVSLSGANATSFTLSRASIASIAVRGSATFTVVPRTGLAAGTHTATVTVRGNNGIETSFPVSFKVNESRYSIVLDATEVSFAAVDPGYRAPTARTIRATNTGNQPTGALTVGLSGANATSFSLSRASIASIARGGSATFTVVPRTALAAGTHTATVTVRGANAIERSFTVSFEVRPGIYGISLDATAISFSAVDPGYRAPSSRTIRVTNTGNQPTGALTVSLSGTNATSFSLSRSSIASIARGGSATFTVVPRTALAAGIHTATVTVRGANAIERSFTVSFEVRPGIYSIDLNATAISFAAVAPGYRAPSAQTVRVTNTGNQATGTLTLSLSGTNATSFSLSRSSLASIARGGSSTFTVVPRTGLAPGIYEATVNVRGANVMERSSTVRFVVNAAVYSVALSTTAIDFLAANAGYRAQSAQTVRVTNDGNQATGALTIALSGTNAASFTLSRTSLTSIAVGGSATFTVVPRTGLAAGSYEALVTVRGTNGISESFTVSFTVR